MAWFTYICPEHGTFRASLLRRSKQQPCPECGADSKIVLRAGSVRSTEIRDNGAMARSVERLTDIEEIMEERADKHTRDTMEKLGFTEEE